jgi:hypothetical protein
MSGLTWDSTVNLGVIIQIVLAGFTFLSLLATVVALIFTHKQLKRMNDDHEASDEKHEAEMEKARREKAGDIIRQYVESTDSADLTATLILEKLTYEQYKKLYERIPFEVSPEIREEICQLCPYYRTAQCGNETPEKKCSCTDCIVEGRVLNCFRSHVMRYLNLLETALIPWFEGVADKELMEEQFEFLGNRNLRKTTDFLLIADGGRSYRILQVFLERLKERKKSELNKMSSKRRSELK